MSRGRPRHQSSRRRTYSARQRELRDRQARIASQEPAWLEEPVWLKEPMNRLVGEFNRTAEKLGETQDNLEARMELTSEIRRGNFMGRVAGPAGAFLCDAIVQAEGLNGLRAALEKGPRAFFDAYDRAAQKDRGLVPLSHVIREKLGRK